MAQRVHKSAKYKQLDSLHAERRGACVEIKHKERTYPPLIQCGVSLSLCLICGHFVVCVPEASAVEEAAQWLTRLAGRIGSAKFLIAIKPCPPNQSNIT